MRHSDANDADAAYKLLHQVAVLGITRYDAQGAGLTRAHDIHDLIVGNRVGQIETAGGIPSDIGVAVDAGLASRYVRRLKDLTLHARECGFEVGGRAGERGELLITPGAAQT